MHTNAFGTPAYTTGYMCGGNSLVTAGQDEPFHIRQYLVHAVDLILEQEDIGFFEIRNFHGRFFFRIAGQG